MANCVGCGVSNFGVGRAALIVVDGQWFCEDCLPSKKGKVKCQTCGTAAFATDDHFKTVNGQYMCTSCMEKAGIVKKHEYVMQALASSMPSGGKPAAPAGGQSDAAANLGGLRILLDENLSPGESVTLSLQGNAGEAIACSKNNLYVLKSGLAMGSITGRKCSKYAWSEVSGLELKVGSLYGVLEVKNPKLPTYDPNDVTKAKKADNAVTFLLSRKPEFDQALSAMQSYLHK
ncbi:MAG: hypothetical protein ACM3WU_10725 [Bacillota bacterium]